MTCNAKSSQDEQVNYQELAPLKVELVKEITGGDSYLPGRLRDLLIIGDSTMLVSDVGTNTIEQFTTEGEHVATIAKAVGGPVSYLISLKCTKEPEIHSSSETG
ncbi:hypothetical protein NC796_21955 [Aliifodinibius sp. S!AR15-10]|nr:hypothetical protein [Aliifodinibius sp. S!AR15-10]